MRHAAALRAMSEAAPSRHLAWLPLQWSFLCDPGKRKLIRAGNQYFGKTAALCEEMRRRGEQAHPDASMRHPRRMICISPSTPQSVSIQKKLWECLDKTLIDPRTMFDPVLGFRGRYPAVRWKNGTVLLFKSGEAGAISFAGETVDDVFIDEPTTLALYQEAERRVTMRDGYVIMGMTPINAKEPLDWLRQLVDLGVVSEHHAKLDPEQMVPVGHDEPRCTADGHPIDAGFIESQRRAIIGHDAAIRLDGDWETPPEDQAFPAYDPRVGGQHVSRTPPPRGLDLDIYVGIDHGERDHKQCAVLVGVAMAGEYPEVWILDEWVGDGLTTPEDDARGILDMLARWNLKWNPKDIKGARGDKPHDIGGRFAMARKSNIELQVAIARRMGMAPGSLKPPIWQAKTGAGGGRGSVRRGVEWLHTIMLRPGMFHVMEHCERTRESLSRWAWQDDEHKDIIDALRYALWDPTMRTQRITAGRPAMRAP